ncbi:cytochrome P450, partial [Bisporella sp. PMI_857]
ANGKPFKVVTPSNEYLLIISEKLIKEVMDAPLDKLSLHAVAKEVGPIQLLQPKHTMYGFEWQDKRGLDGIGFVRALRSLLTAHLPALQPNLEHLIKDGLEQELGQKGDDDFTSVRLFGMIKRMITKINCFAFFGEVLSQNNEFTAAALEFPEAVIIAAELLRITPGFLQPLVAAMATKRHRAARTLFRHLEPIVRERLELRHAQAEAGGFLGLHTQTNCMQWLIEASPRKKQWSPERMVGEIVAVWFSSVHQLAMITTFAIEDLFIKESIRCNCSDAVTGRRKALVPCTFSGGSVSLAAGDWVCVPQRAMMHDAQRYSDPDIFDGFRFARANDLLCLGQRSRAVPDDTPSLLTTTNIDWPIWGLWEGSFPGRFYASRILKLMLVHILEQWECKLLDPAATRYTTWRTSIVPREDTVVLFRRSQQATYRLREIIPCNHHQISSTCLAAKLNRLIVQV